MNQAIHGGCNFPQHALEVNELQQAAMFGEIDCTTTSTEW